MYDVEGGRPTSANTWNSRNSDSEPGYQLPDRLFLLLLPRFNGSPQLSLSLSLSLVWLLSMLDKPVVKHYITAYLLYEL